MNMRLIYFSAMVLGSCEMIIGVGDMHWKGLALLLVAGILLLEEGL